KIKKLRILNVGCGNETYGTHFVDLYPSRKEVIKCDVNKQKLPFPSNFFDIVYSKNLFEHLTNPEFALREMKRVLKPKGKLILITDYAHSWNFAVGRTHLGGYEKGCKREDRHYLLVNEWHLKNWFEKVGLVPIKTEFIEDDYIGNYLIKKLFKKMINKLLQNTPFKRMGYMRIKMIGKKL
ncbi:MAG: methyltransferase domain-containing protein, partial [Candidatus Aenigmatarchaeota archaeon]